MPTRLNPSFYYFSVDSLVTSLCHIMEFILFNMTFTCTIIIAFNLFVVETNGVYSFETAIAFLDLGLVLGLTFAYFYLAEHITTDLLGIADIFYNSPWYRLGTKRQILFVLPIQRAQREMRLTGLGLFECSLVVFSKVMRIYQFGSKSYVKSF